MKAFKKLTTARKHQPSGPIVRIRGSHGDDLFVCIDSWFTSIEIVEEDGAIKSWISAGCLQRLGNGNLAAYLKED